MRSTPSWLLFICFFTACDQTGDDAPLEDANDGAVAARTDAGTTVPEDGGVPRDGSIVSDDAGAGEADGGPNVPPASSIGCGKPAEHPTGGVQVSQDFGPSADGERSYYLVLPDNYDPSTPHRLVFGYAGTNWSGEMIRPYLGLEAHGSANDIFVYPDVLFRSFGGGAPVGGWILGPHGAPYEGREDIEFTRALANYLAEQYCVDRERIFATGHSWGGDIAAVVSCFLGDLFRASVPVAANRPFWFEPRTGAVGCVGAAAVWTMFGQNETHFTYQSYPGEFGEEQVAFWRAHHGCADGAATDLDIGAPNECVEYDGCSSATRYCFYYPGAGHQIPSRYFAEETMRWFHSL